MSAPTLDTLAPMLLAERKAVPRDAGWLCEIKYDGYRVLASTGPQPRLRSRNGADATTWFPEIIETLKALPPGLILDGEVCVLDEIGRSDFDRLHARARRRGWYEGADPVVYCAFDLIVGKGRDLRARAIEKRKAALASLFAAPLPGLLLVSAVTDDAAWLYRQALTLDLEGIVCKRIGSTYQDGIRSPDWIKVKRPGAVPPERFKRKPRA